MENKLQMSLSLPQHDKYSISSLFKALQRTSESSDEVPELRLSADSFGKVSGNSSEVRCGGADGDMPLISIASTTAGTGVARRRRSAQTIQTMAATIKTATTAAAVPSPTAIASLKFKRNEKITET